MKARSVYARHGHPLTGSEGPQPPPQPSVHFSRGAGYRIGGSMTYLLGYLGRPSLPSNCCTGGQGGWGGMCGCAHRRLVGTCCKFFLDRKGMHIAHSSPEARTAMQVSTEVQVRSTAFTAPPTLRRRLCFCSAHCTICSMPTVEKMAAGRACGCRAGKKRWDGGGRGEEGGRGPKGLLSAGTVPRPLLHPWTQLSHGQGGPMTHLDRHREQQPAQHLHGVVCAGDVVEQEAARDLVLLLPRLA